MAKFESPLKPIKPFPGDQSGPGIYGDNPHLGPAQDGEPKFKFFEKIDQPPTNEFDSPFNMGDGKLGDKAGVDPTGGEAPKASAGWDSPMTPLKKL